MRIRIRFAFLAPALALLLALPGAALAKLQVVATLPEIAALAEEIGDERVEVRALVWGDEDPHVLSAKPSHSRHLMKADLLVYNGLQLEVGWLPLLLQGARNSDIQEGRPGHLDLSESIAPLEIPAGGVDRSQGDVHPEGNPHFTVDPGVYPALARALAERLAALDPGGAAFYEKRLAAFVAGWEPRLAAWRERLAFLAGVRIVTYHKQWEYAARRFGFEIVDYVENRPGIPPSPRHIAELQERIRREEIPLLIYSDLVHADSPEKLARRGGARALALPQSVGSREGTETLTGWFETWVSLLEAAGREER